MAGFCNFKRGMISQTRANLVKLPVYLPKRLTPLKKNACSGGQGVVPLYGFLQCIITISSKNFDAVKL
jgi:hypothetical protein